MTGETRIHVLALHLIEKKIIFLTSGPDFECEPTFNTIEISVKIFSEPFNFLPTERLSFFSFTYTSKKVKFFGFIYISFKIILY